MRQFLVKYIDCLIPFCGGVIVLLFPQVFTKRDLAAEENAKIRKRLRLIGVFLIVAGTGILLASLCG